MPWIASPFWGFFQWGYQAPKMVIFLAIIAPESEAYSIYFYIQVCHANDYNYLTRSAVVPISWQTSHAIWVTVPSKVIWAFDWGVAQRLFIAFGGLNSTDNLRVLIGIEVVLMGIGNCVFEIDDEDGCGPGELNGWLINDVIL